MLANRGINALVLLRLIGTFFSLLLILFGVFAAFYLISLLLTRRSARRMGTAVVPIGVRLVPHLGSISEALGDRAARLREAGYLEVGRWVTDRLPRTVLIGFVSPDGDHGAYAIDHPKLGIGIELFRSDTEGRTVGATDLRLPLGSRRPPWMRLTSRPGAPVARLRRELERLPLPGAPRAADAESFVGRFEASYRRSMEWAYTEGPLRGTDPEAVARFTGVPADPDTVYFLRMRREAAGKK